MNRPASAKNYIRIRGLCLGILLFISACSSGLPTPGSPSATKTPGPLISQTRILTPTVLTALPTSPSLNLTSEPTVTLTPTPTMTKGPASQTTPVLLTITPQPVDSILKAFPLVTGATWTYSYSLYDPAPNDPTQTIQGVFELTQAVVETKSVGQDFFARISQKYKLVREDPGWSDQSGPPVDGDFWYILHGNIVYSSQTLPADPQTIDYSQLNLEYVFPLVKGAEWCPSSIGKPRVGETATVPPCNPVGKRIVVGQGSYQSSAGSFNSCYQIVDTWNTGYFRQTFCEGVGLVEKKFDHGGTLFGFSQVLTGFTAGKGAAPLTQTPSFSQNAPWLIVQSGTDLFYYHPGSAGWATYENPEKFSALDIMPDNGRGWVAIHGVKGAGDNSGQFLELLHLTDSQIIPVAQLDINLTQANADRVNGINSAIPNGKMLWSPDGRTLAIQAVLGGSQTTDIYIVQIDQPHLTRLTHQSYNADILSWAPDSRRLIYTEVTPCAWNGCFTDSVWSVDLDGQAEKLFDTPAASGMVVIGFTPAGRMIICTRSNLGTYRSLVQVDLSTGQSQSLYSGDFYEAAVDPASGKVLFSVFASGLADGYYFVTTPGADPQRVDLAFSGTSLRWLPAISMFRVCPGEGGCNGLTLISPEGQTNRVTGEKSDPIPSPDGSYLAYTYIIGDNPVDTYNLGGIRIYDRSMVLLRTFADSRMGMFIWSSDSKGFFYVADRVIYYQDLAAKMPETIDRTVPGDPTRDQYTWVN